MDWPLKGRYELRVQLGQRGCYAAVELECEVVPARESRDPRIEHPDPYWHEACRIGVQIFNDYHPVRYDGEPGRLCVRFVRVEWQHIDTGFMTVVFATVRALAAAFQADIPGLVFDAETASFHFPERVARFPVSGGA